MVKLIIGLLLFHAVHLIPTKRPLRDNLVTRLGQSGYMGVFSLLSIVALALIVMGYGDARGLVRSNPQVFVPPVWTRHVTSAVMLIAIILLVAAYVPSRIRDAVGHPMLMAIKAWAFAHLLVRGDLASIALFGSFLAYAVYDLKSVKARGARGPLGNALGTARGDVIVVVVGLALYALVALWGHAALIGVPVARMAVSP